MIDAIADLLRLIGEGLTEVGLRLDFALADYMCQPYFDADGAPIVANFYGCGGCPGDPFDPVKCQDTAWILNYWIPPIYGRAPEGWGTGNFGELPELMVFFNKTAAPLAHNTGEQTLAIGRIIAELADFLRQLI